ncbi:MAG: EAL domain-containing protein [Bradyrhizobiaceae bacterium]|nr:EAL domain-containing protein [Bradyrhizobiaceae bacterium]
MARLQAVFLAVCMVLIAGSVGAVLYLYYGFLRIEAAVVAVAVLTGLALFNALTARARDRADVGDQIADLSRGTADLARQVADIGRRLSAAETEVARSPDHIRALADPLSAEIGVLGGLFKELADSVAAHEAVLTGVTRTVAAPAVAPAAPGPETAKTVDRAELGEPESDQKRPAGGRFKGMTRGDVVALLCRAVEANRVDLYLQPIVTLPQRKVRYYEALARLRSDDGELLQPADFLEIAESGGLMPMIDNVMLFRCVQVVRRLAAKNREIGLFCNIAPDTLIDSANFPQFSEFMEANRALAAALVFEFSQTAVRAMGPIEQESLAALAQLGFRFSMDRVTDLKIEPRELAARGFRFVKVPANLLMARAATAAADIHPADFSDLLGRFGVDLIAEKIESEGTVVDLLDFDVRFGQGFLFSPPRPVRAEVLQGLADPTAAGARRAPVVEPEAPRRGGEGQLVSRVSGIRTQETGVRNETAARSPEPASRFRTRGNV